MDCTVTSPSCKVCLPVTKTLCSSDEKNLLTACICYSWYRILRNGTWKHTKVVTWNVGDSVYWL